MYYNEDREPTDDEIEDAEIERSIEAKEEFDREDAYEEAQIEFSIETQNALGQGEFQKRANYWERLLNKGDIPMRAFIEHIFSMGRDYEIQKQPKPLKIPAFKGVLFGPKST